ncbi:alcohol dehydrogenase catalytic domain-containing protein [Jiangella asiatica]|uniref:Zn-dependent alcohol dehydrogenase n=1 Tax=Jiangella asiatica TaxID=2530372 RepID=A0A4R5D4N1_9ACTN|nr:alcohol dehydrogenase catalytic domain-containing protein [Jiangella asiatica]TDE08362.1 Zn-dependent alcohol dehydrogenase [Jiangella asiatica]
MSTATRAAVLRSVGAPLTVEELRLEEPRPGEIRVEIEAAGVCHSDLHYMNGDLRGKLPAVLGHEGVGIVDAVGDGVTRFRPGDRVLMTWRPRCGDCEFCTSGRPTLCVLGRVQGTTGGLPDGTTRLSKGSETIHHLMGVSCFAEFCVVSERSAVAIPHDIPAEVAAIAGCAVVTGVGTVLNVMRQAAGQPVVVIGAGGVGISAVMGLALVGAAPIIVADTVAPRLALAAEVGATSTVNVSVESLPDVVKGLSADGAGWAIDAVGSPTTLEQAFGLLKTGGTLVAVGLTDANAAFQVPVNLLVQHERRIVGSLYGSSNPVVQVPLILDLFRAGRLPIDRLVGATYPLDAVNDAYAALASGSVGRSIIVPGSTSSDYSRAPSRVDSSRAPVETSAT